MRLAQALAGHRVEVEVARAVLALALAATDIAGVELLAWWAGSGLADAFADRHVKSLARVAGVVVNYALEVALLGVPSQRGVSGLLRRAGALAVVAVPHSRVAEDVSALVGLVASA